MVKLKDILANGNFDLDETTTSKAEAPRLLQQLSNANRDDGEHTNTHQGVTPQHSS